MIWLFHSANVIAKVPKSYQTHALITKNAAAAPSGDGQAATHPADDMKRKQLAGVLTATTALLLLAATTQAQEIQGGAGVKPIPMSKNLAPVSQGMLDGAAKDSKNWLHSNGDYGQTRFHPATQINSGNVAKLKPAFVFQSAVIESMATAPIVVNGVMFLTTSFNHVYAVDAVTNEEFWHYQYIEDDVWDVDAVSPPILVDVKDKSGKIAWQTKTEQPMIGGALATAGNLLFAGEGNGWFNAYDAKTG